MQLRGATYARCELWKSGQIPKDYIMTIDNQKKIQPVLAAKIHGVEHETRSMFLDTTALCRLICSSIPGSFGLKAHLCKRNV